MCDFLQALSALSIEGRRPVSLRRGLMLDDVFSFEKMLVLITSGSLEVLGRSGNLVNILTQGDAFGVSNLFIDSPLPSRLRARDDVELVLLPKEGVRRAMDADTSLYRSYCAMLNGRLEFLMSRVSLLGIKNNRRRLASYLLDGCQVRFSSREELASYLALGKSALFRELAYFGSLGAIDYSGQSITVLDKNILMEVLNA